MMKLALLCCALTAAVARASVYFSPAVIPSSSTGYGVPLQQALYNYRGPLSLAPGQPANILAADGRPLDTLDVNLDRTAHFVAKALDNAPRSLTKRSVTRLAVAPGPVGYAAALAAGNVGISSPVGVGPASASAIIATNPVGVSTPLATGAFGLTSPYVVGPIGLSAPVTAGSLALSSPITAGTVAMSAPAAGGSIGVSATGTPIARTF